MHALCGHVSVRELLDREQRCEVARSTASVFRCKEGGQRVLVTFIPPSSKLHGGIAQLVERLVRNEKARGSNPLTSNFRVCENDLTHDADHVMHLPVEG